MSPGFRKAPSGLHSWRKSFRATARELIKLHETILKTSLGDALAAVERDENMRKGEFVVIVDGATPDKNEQTLSPEQLKVLSVLLRECGIKTAVAITAEITDVRKNQLDQAALAMAGREKK